MIKHLLTWMVYKGAQEYAKRSWKPGRTNDQDVSERDYVCRLIWDLQRDLRAEGYPASAPFLIET